MCRYKEVIRYGEVYKVVINSILEVLLWTGD